MPKTGEQSRDEVGIYFHIPFCSKKCPYCHFYTVPHKEHHEEQWISALKKEWQKQKPLLEGKSILTVYFGGGTPSLLSPHIIETLLHMVGGSPKETTLEANPETVSSKQLSDYRGAGVNRISFGVQSLCDPELAILGRKHIASTAERAVHAAHRAGFDNITIDLMFELPGQTLTSWEETLCRTARLPINHLSLYNLTFEPHTPFHRRKNDLLPLTPNDEEKVVMLDMAVEKCRAIGLNRYEISAFAKKGFASLHNSGYWLGRPFLGLGPSAFSFWNGKRFRNVPSLYTWANALAQENSPVDFEEQLSVEDSFNELLAIGLRMLEGVDLANQPAIPERTGKVIDRLVQEGFIIREGSLVRLSKEGLLFYDDVAISLV